MGVFRDALTSFDALTFTPLDITLPGIAQRQSVQFTLLGFNLIFLPQRL
jgi:hypothetical protein